MTDQEALITRYKAISDRDLIHVTLYPEEYVDGAQKIAENELISRELSEQEISDISNSLKNEKVQKEINAEKAKQKQAKISSKINRILAHFGPSKEDKPVKKIVFYFSIFLAFISIYQLYSLIRDLFYYGDYLYYDWKDRIGLISPTVFSVIMVWGLLKHYKIGWILTMSWATLSVLSLLFFWGVELSSDYSSSGQGGMLDILNSFQQKGTYYYLIQLFMFGLISAFMLRKPVRELFKIKTSNIILSVLIGAGFVIFMIYH